MSSKHFHHYIGCISFQEDTHCFYFSIINKILRMADIVFSTHLSTTIFLRIYSTSLLHRNFIIINHELQFLPSFFFLLDVTVHAHQPHALPRTAWMPLVPCCFGSSPSGQRTPHVYKVTSTYVPLAYWHTKDSAAC